MDLICKSIYVLLLLLLVTSGKQCQDRCSRPPTHATNYRKSVSNFLSSLLANRQGILNRPITARSEILVYREGGGRGGGRTRISACEISERVPPIIGTLRSDNVHANGKVTKRLTSLPFKLFRPHNKSPSDLTLRKLGWN